MVTSISFNLYVGEGLVPPAQLASFSSDFEHLDYQYLLRRIGPCSDCVALPKNTLVLW